MPTGSVIVRRASSSELSDGMRCLVGEEGSVEAGVSTLVSTEIEYNTDSLVRISYIIDILDYVNSLKYLWLHVQLLCRRVGQASCVHDFTGLLSITFQ